MARFLSHDKVQEWPRTKDDDTKFDHFLASRLTSLFAVLHKFCIFNWLPTKNEQYVTQEQARILYKLGKGQRVNLGRSIFKHIANWGKVKKITYFPYPSLVFQVLKYQNIPLDPNDEYNTELDIYTVDPQLRKASNVRYTKDLPWDRSKDPKTSVTTHAAPSASDASPSVPSSVPPSVPPSVTPTAAQNAQSFFAGTDAQNLLVNVFSLLHSNSPTIPKTTVLPFLHTLVEKMGQAAIMWTQMQDDVQVFINMISSQPGGDISAAADDVTTSAGTVAGTNEHEEEEEDEEQDEE